MSTWPPPLLPTIPLDPSWGDIAKELLLLLYLSEYTSLFSYHIYVQTLTNEIVNHDGILGRHVSWDNTFTTLWIYFDSQQLYTPSYCPLLRIEEKKTGGPSLPTTKAVWAYGEKQKELFDRVVKVQDKKGDVPSTQPQQVQEEARIV